MPPDFRQTAFLKSLLIYGPCCYNCVYGIYCYTAEMLKSPQYALVGCGCAECHYSNNSKNYRPLYEIEKK